MISELYQAAFIYYLVAVVNLSCYVYVINSTAPQWLKIGAWGVGLLVCWNVIKTSATFVEYLLS